MSNLESETSILRDEYRKARLGLSTDKFFTQVKNFEFPQPGEWPASKPFKHDPNDPIVKELKASYERKRFR